MNKTVDRGNTIQFYSCRMCLIKKIKLYIHYNIQSEILVIISKRSPCIIFHFQNETFIIHKRYYHSSRFKINIILYFIIPNCDIPIPAKIS